MVDLALRGVVMASHCDQHLLTAVYTVGVRLMDPFSPSGPFVLHMVVFGAVGLGELVVEGAEDRCDIHAQDQSLVCEGLDDRTVNAQRADDDQVDVVLPVERMGLDGNAAAAMH